MSISVLIRNKLNNYLRCLMLGIFLISNVLETSFVAFAQQEELPVIDEVLIEGNRLISAPLIMKQLRTQSGKKFSRLDIDKDIKRLFGLNYFNKIDVAVEEGEQFKVIFMVEEKPAINKISFKGNKKYKDKELKKHISLQEGELLNESKVSADIVSLREFYEQKGYKKALINREISYIDGHLADLTYHVKEGGKIRIKKINIIGASQIKEKKVLKIMKTKSKRWYNSAKFEEIKFNEDLERIKAYYYQQGFIDVKILKVEDYLLDDRNMVIDIHINEGSLYNVAAVSMEGNEKFSKEQLLTPTKIRVGETYLPGTLSEDVKVLKDQYLKEGYIDAKIGVDTLLGEEKDTLKIHYIIQENDVAFVDQVVIRGNVKTKDIVIRRELNIEPGERYDGVKMQVAQKRLSNLGLFKKVDVYADPEEIDASRDMYVEVEEDRTGELSFGAGYSSVDEFTGFMELSQSNFDLFRLPSLTGDGQKLKLRSTFGRRRKEFLLDFTEPWMFGKRLLFGFELFKTERSFQNSDFSEEREGVEFKLAKPIFKYTRGEVRYLYETVEVLNVDDDASEILKAQEGERKVGKVSFILTRDVRDSFFNATKGSKIRLTTEIAGVGGEIEYHRLIYDQDLYFNPWLDHVLVVSMRVGAVQEYGDTEDVPIFDRFFLGGPRSIRGFDFRDIGPHDEQEEPLGGEFMYHGTLEYVVPLADQFQVATFFDFGNLYEDVENIKWSDWNASAGVGLRFQMPIGPLRLDYAWPVVTDDFHDGESGKFTFDIGHRF